MSIAQPSVTIILILLIVVTGSLSYAVWEKTRKNRLLSNLSYTDPVTGYPNYEKFKLDTRDFICPVDGAYALIYSDVHNFKYINDLYGHPMGDWILRETNEIITTHLLPGEYACRMNADHFVQLKKYKDWDDLETQMNHINCHLAEILSRGNVLYRLIFRSGVYLLPAGGLSLDPALDSAIYAKKNITSNVYSSRLLYDEKMRADSQKERELEQDLTHSIRDREFEVWYQNKVDIDTEQIVGAEALVRWRHPRKGLLSPGLFVPFCEKSGFVVQLDYFVFEEVCSQLRELADAGIPTVPISSNFSRVHFDGWDVTERCAAITEKYHIPHDWLEIEITEEGTIGDIHSISEKLGSLHDAGFSLAIDDFGSGVSPVQLLYDLPVDVLKMDRSTLDPHTNSQVHWEVVDSIVHIALANDIHIVFEGVETDEQLQMVRDFGGRCVQGYYYSKPAPFSSFKAQLEAQAKEKH